MLKFWIAGTLLLPLAVPMLAAPTGGSNCENLSKLSLPNVTINSAETVAAGAFTPSQRLDPSARLRRYSRLCLHSAA